VTVDDFIHQLWKEGTEETMSMPITTFTREQYWASYPSWSRGGDRAWNRYGLGGTDTMHAIMWYQHIHKPGSREHRPKIIMDAVKKAAEAKGDGNGALD